MGPIIAARFRNHAHTLVSNDAGKRFMMAYLQVVNEEQPPHQYHQSSKPEAVSDGKNTSMPVSLRDYRVAHCDVCPNNGRLHGFSGMAIQKLVIRTCMPWDTWDITSISENSAT